MMPVRCVLIAFGIQVLLATGSVACSFEKFGDSPHLRIAGSPWVIDVWGQACGFGVSGGTEIRAVNDTNQETKTIATFGDIVSSITMSSNEPGSLTIELPNLVDLIDAQIQFADVRVIYKFTPFDDAEARTNFQRWKRHPDDPQGRRWACENIYKKMDQTNGSFWNRFFTEVAGLSGETYCPKN